MRLFLGLLVATLAIMIEVTAGLYVVGYKEIEILIIILIPGTIFVFLSLLLVGLPVHFVLYAKDKTSLSDYVITGTLVGDLFLFVLTAPQNPSQFFEAPFSYFLYFSVYGFTAAVVFWPIAVRPEVAK